MGVMVIGVTLLVTTLYFPMWGGMFCKAKEGFTEEDYYLGEYTKERVPRIAATIGGGHEQTPRWYFSGDEMFDIRSAPGG